ncbi:metal ABC transporter substrate-binding protein [Cellulomonas aerilata]|uniref:Zinc ABC transporter substrate-binding protein n=1 Tax=Cellulomonas aerilata TaxID=515326 RepID=A0A512DBL1_9CELL|nr:metal ABC transporter substrate-binding protein [Cellulomonas aerilata]GEO33871.1 zinc ABC transporter substrate-binding protein [Cellulomonas aerilata]
MPRSALALSGALAAGVLLLAACSSGPQASAADEDRTQVLASFYPLQYVAQQVGGDLVEVSSLTPPGAEPHDVELSPRQVRSVSETDLVLYLSGFQSAVDEAVDARQPQRVVDAADVVDLLEGGAHAHGEGEQHAEEHAAEEADAHEEEGDAHAVDPHFWLDPQRLAALAQPVADALAEIDPANADAFSAAADELAAALADVDAAYGTGLATCERRVAVTSHEAYGYLADAYDLEQVGMSGLDPEAEPSPARLREIGDVVRANGVTTLFTETLVNPKVAETLAGDLGVTTAVLDPIESQPDSGADYRAVMEQNLEALRAGLGCS